MKETKLYATLRGEGDDLLEHCEFGYLTLQFCSQLQEYYSPQQQTEVIVKNVIGLRKNASYLQRISTQTRFNAA